MPTSEELCGDSSSGLAAPTRSVVLFVCSRWCCFHLRLPPRLHEQFLKARRCNSKIYIINVFNFKSRRSCGIRTSCNQPDSCIFVCIVFFSVYFHFVVAENIVCRCLYGNMKIICRSLYGNSVGRKLVCNALSRVNLWAPSSTIKINDPTKSWFWWTNSLMTIHILASIELEDTARRYGSYWNCLDEQSDGYRFVRVTNDLQ